MNELIFAIFNALAEVAMEKGMQIDLKYENTQYDSQTIISKTKKDSDALTMNIWPDRVHVNDEKEMEEENHEEDQAN